MKKTYKSILILVSLIMLLFFTIINTNFFIDNFIDYSSLFIRKLFPTSFIFFIISSLLLDYGIIYYIERLFHIRVCSLFLLLISMISGFPSGAKYIVDLLNKGQINEKEANKYILFCHFPNPLFILGPVSGILNNRKLTISILLSIIISNIVIMFFSRSNVSSNFNNEKISCDFTKSLKSAIESSFKTIFMIYGISIFFYLISCIITKYIYINSSFYIMICGLFDLTKGVYSTLVIYNCFFRAIFILFFISFGSISIHMQVNSIISNSSIKYSSFLKGRIIGFIISLFIFLLMTK